MVHPYTTPPSLFQASYSQSAYDVCMPHVLCGSTNLQPGYSKIPTLSCHGRPFSSRSRYASVIRLSKSPSIRYPRMVCNSMANIDEDDGDKEEEEEEEEEEDKSELESGDEVFIKIEKLGKNTRRIQSRIAVDAPLDTIWKVLTDYERLADFIPGLALCQLLHKGDNYARLYQIGQQNLAFGLKFNAKGIVDCYEKELESLPFGQKRDIEFKMIEGDFQLFEGKWSVEQSNNGRNEDSDSLLGKTIDTTLSYLVDAKPKPWLPVWLIEGRLCKEIKMNLICIRGEAQKAVDNTLHPH